MFVLIVIHEDRFKDVGSLEDDLYTGLSSTLHFQDVFIEIYSPLP